MLPTSDTPLRSTDEATIEVVTEIDTLLAELRAIRAAMVAHEAAHRDVIDALPPERRVSARNLIHYVSLRGYDLRRLQQRLAARGLSSLGRAEPHVLENVDAVLRALAALAGGENPAGGEPREHDAEPALERGTRLLLGPEPSGRRVRIMVTMPTEAADDPLLVRRLMEAGMDCARINCAHDDPDAWERMIGIIRRTSVELGRNCAIFMDLAGPKIRTGPIEPGPRVVKWHPERDLLGRAVVPARIWITPEDRPERAPCDVDVTLPFDRAFVERLDVGDALRFTDARRARRSMSVRAVRGAGRLCESNHTAYVTAGMRMTHRPRGGAGDVVGIVGAIPPVEQAISLEVGDHLIVTRTDAPGTLPLRDARGELVAPARIGVTLGSIVDDVRPGESIWFDDGKIGGVIVQVRGGEIEVEVRHASAGGAKLRADKGINLPETALGLPPLTAKDIEDLSFIVAHADAVCYSFVKGPDDVRALRERLADCCREEIGIVLKIETRSAFERLPEIMIETMRSPSAGIMIARGDLAIESGFERMAEVQEEILWLSEAAHMPVIWATQVLENLSKTGLPSRAEITDAAMAERAECVMLNKGPFLVDAVRTLADILRRMETHQSKKRSMLRHLGLADRFFLHRPDA
jgi:pyruvate kinase